ncbi:hypothetical protein V1505DRAFT_424042, partial [Lipomyces doorenjongii]
MYEHKGHMEPPKFHMPAVCKTTPKRSAARPRERHATVQTAKASHTMQRPTLSDWIRHLLFLRYFTSFIICILSFFCFCSFSLSRNLNSRRGVMSGAGRQGFFPYLHVVSITRPGVSDYICVPSLPSFFLFSV